MNRKLHISAFLLAAFIACATPSAFTQTNAGVNHDQGAKQDMKNAGHDTKDAAKNAGEGTKKETKKAYHSTKHGTKKAWNKTKNTTKGAVDGGKQGAKQPASPR